MKKLKDVPQNQVYIGLKVWERHHKYTGIIFDSHKLPGEDLRIDICWPRGRWWYNMSVKESILEVVEENDEYVKVI